jgi:hypothetical protein
MFGNEKVEGTIFKYKMALLNEWVAYKKITNCTNIIELRNTGIYL